MPSEVEIKRLVVRLVGEAASYVSTIKQSITGAKQLADAVDEVTVAEKSNKIATDAVTLATDKYNRQMKDLAEAHDQGKISISEYTAQSVKLKEELRRTTSGVDALQKKIKSVSDGLSSFGRNWSMYVTAPLSGLGALAAHQSSEFQTSMSQIVGLVGLSKESVAELSEEVKKMAPVTGKGPVELARALYDITGSGFEGAAAIDALNVSARAAAAGLGETKGVADAITSAINAYGMANLSAARAGDILTATVREGKGEASSFAPVFGQLLPIAVEMGVEFEEVGGILAFLTKSTGNASIAATGLRGVMSALLRPSEKAKESLAQLGISTDQVRQAISDRGLLNVVSELRRRLEQTGVPLTEVFTDIEGLNAALQLTGPQAKDAADVLESVANSAGSVDKAFQAATETVGFKWNQTMAETQVRLIELGDIVAPVLLNFNNLIREAAGYWDDLDLETQTTIVTMAGFVAALGPLALGLGTTITMVNQTITMLNLLGIQLTATQIKAFGAKAALAGLAIGLGVTLGYALAQVMPSMLEFNHQLARAAELSDELNSVQAKAQREIINKASNLEGQQQIAFLQQEIANAKKNMSGMQGRIDADQADVNRFDTAFNRASGNKNLIAAQQELGKSKADFAQAERFVETLEQQLTSAQRMQKMMGQMSTPMFRDDPNVLTKGEEAAQKKAAREAEAFQKSIQTPLQRFQRETEFQGIMFRQGRISEQDARAGFAQSANRFQATGSTENNDAVLKEIATKFDQLIALTRQQTNPTRKDQQSQIVVRSINR